VKAPVAGAATPAAAWPAATRVATGALGDLLEDDALVIFLFHGVIPAARPGVRNYTGKHLPADEFRALCAGLAARGTPVSADDAVAMLRGERPLPQRAFLISFDDGFANNLTVAAPILSELGIPAVFYVTTSFVGAGGASWIDLIEEAIERFAGDELALPWDHGAPRPAGTREQRIALLEEVRRVVKGSAALDPYAVADEIRTPTPTASSPSSSPTSSRRSWT
jgi:peptidoglycan/xylan/chitin deacetylase (PgdA/CDA1 family)